MAETSLPSFTPYPHQALTSSIAFLAGYVATPGLTGSHFIFADENRYFVHFWNEGGVLKVQEQPHSSWIEALDAIPRKKLCLNPAGNARMPLNQLWSNADSLMGIQQFYLGNVKKRASVAILIRPTGEYWRSRNGKISDPSFSNIELLRRFDWIDKALSGSS